MDNMLANPLVTISVHVCKLWRSLGDQRSRPLPSREGTCPVPDIDPSHVFGIDSFTRFRAFDRVFVRVDVRKERPHAAYGKTDRARKSDLPP
jgi:hypothetical protein